MAAHFDEFCEVITLYEPESKCSLKTTELRTIRSIYEESDTPEITDGKWSRIHRFIRLWRKLGWSLHEVDLVLTGLGEDDIQQTIGKLSSFSLLAKAAKVPLNQLAVFWGNIDTYGNKSLYRKLFLNKAAHRVDDAFKPDVWGKYLQDVNETLAEHVPAILAACCNGGRPECRS